MRATNYQDIDRRKFLAFSGAIAGGMSACSGTHTIRNFSHSANRMPSGHSEDLESIFPSPKPCRSLYAVDIRNCNPDELQTFVILQGLVNRKRPRLYLISTEHCESWLQYYREAYGIENQIFGSPYTLLEVFRDEIGGYRIYDQENLHTMNLASSMSRLDNLLPVHPSLESQMQIAGLQCKDDLRGKFHDRFEVYRWSIDNLLNSSSKRVIANQCVHRPSWNTITCLSADLFVSSEALQIDLSTSRAHPRDVRLWHEILERYESPGFVVGWHCCRDHEHEAVSLAAEHGFFALCNLRSTNYSVHQGAGSKPRKKYVQPIPKDRAASVSRIEQKAYIALLYSDGDAAWAPTTHMDDQWEQPERGKIPMNWGFMTTLHHLGPGLLEYYQNTRTDMDYFIAGPSGLAYTYPHLHPNPKPFLRMTREAMKTLGLRVANTVTWDPRLAHHGVTPSATHELLRDEIPEALGFVRGHAESVWEPSLLDEKAPIVYGSLAIHRNDQPLQRIEDLVNTLPNRPLFIFAYVNHHVPLGLLAEAAEKHRHDYEFLRLDEFMLKLHAAIEKGLIKDDLYPEKEGAGAVLIKESRPHWQSALDSVLNMESLCTASEKDCLAFFEKRSGGCDPEDLRSTFQFDLCKNVAAMTKSACNCRGVYVGDLVEAAEIFLRLYSSVPDSEIIRTLSQWWYTFEDDPLKGLPILQDATGRAVTNARWLDKVNKDWPPL